MKLICEKKDCGYSWLVHGSHYMRYPSRVNRCPQEHCDGRGRPDEASREQIRSRHQENNRYSIREDRERTNLERRTVGE